MTTGEVYTHECPVAEFIYLLPSSLVHIYYSNTRLDTCTPTLLVQYIHRIIGGKSSYSYGYDLLALEQLLVLKVKLRKSGFSGKKDDYKVIQ